MIKNISLKGCASYPKIQDAVIEVAKEFEPGQDFHIFNLRMKVHNQYSLTLSYKQTRDALYRVRESVAISHNGRGWYRWDF